jgi:excisionase family DNA binding protein
VSTESEDDDKMLSFAEVARRLGISGHMVTDLVDSGELHAFTPGVGKHRRIWATELVRYRRSKLAKRELYEFSDSNIASQ